jgi:hypothetical protein
MVDVPGITLPQIYVKVKGNWTGGHQENLRVRAANVNLGKGKSMWHCVGKTKPIE